jgi:hypothetical protein
VAIVTPGRLVMFTPALQSGAAAGLALVGVGQILRSRVPVDVAVISYTKLEALNADEEKTKCIPFLGHLMAFAHSGHRVVVFEGHPSAFEAGVRGVDVLIVDSGMVPFLQHGWHGAAFQLMNEGGRVLIHDRTSYKLTELAPQPAAGSAETDQEGVYLNGLLTTVSMTSGRTITIVDGAPLPDLAALTCDARQLAWIANLPLPPNYEGIRPAWLIARLLSQAQPKGLFKRRVVLKAILRNDGGRDRTVSFELTEGVSAEGARKLTIHAL